MKIYPLEQYDEHFALKITPITYLLVAFLMNSIWLSVIALMSKSKMREIIGLAYASTSLHLASVVISIPTIIVLICMVRRHPSAGQTLRSIWSKGRILLLTSSVGLTGILILSTFERRSTPASDIVLIIICCFCIMFTSKSKRFAATFDSFPEEIEK